MKNNDLILREMEKRDEIVNNFHKNYLLEAGAGAGKTTIIVERVINHIENSDINPSNLVAITFTKAAATELAERIQVKALERLKTEEDPEIIQRLKDVDKIFTGTIHSFCDLILREMPFHANLSPGYEIVEDAEEFHLNIWYNFLRDREYYYKDKMELLYRLGIDYMDLRSKALLALENSDIKFIGYDIGDFGFEDLVDEFEKIKLDFEDLEYEHISKGKAIGKLLYGILEDKGDLEDYLNIFNNAFLGKTFDLEEYFQDIHKKSSVFEDKASYKSFIEELYNLYEKIKALPYNVATDFINMLVDYKKENYRGRLTFNELLYRASNLVKTSEEARIHLKNKYKYFYLDESQDTDPMQIELIMHLVDRESEYDGLKSWYNVEPMAGSLFIVGDPKQSIYRFRRADISIYNQLKEVVDKNGEVVYLDINFRSSSEICNWVQSAFKKTYDEDFGFPEEATEAQAGFKQILALWDDSLGEEEEEYRDVHLQGVYKYDFNGLEEEYVADFIYKLKENYMISEKIRQGDDYYNKYRKIEYGDIMILTKTNAETGLYLRSLKERGIAALLAGEKNLGETREVLNLYALIDALVDSEDNIKIVAALRNSFYLDLETIQFFMEEEKDLSGFLFNIDEINNIEHLSLKKAFAYMNEIIKLSEEHSPIAFVEKLLENRLGIYDVNKDYSDLDLRDANASLRQVVEILKTRECYSVYSLREELKTLVFKNVAYELPIDKEEATGALRIMNIHKAKGLEANIVILAGGAKKRFSFPDSHYVEKNEKDETIGYMKYSSKFKTKGPNEDEKGVREDEFKDAELDRLLYVAATRAKAVLIVSNGLEEESFLSPLSNNINRPIELKGQVVEEEKKVKLSSAKEMERKMRRELRIKKEIFPGTYSLSSPSRFKSSMFYGGGSKEIVINSLKLIAVKRMEITNENRRKFGSFGPRGKFYGTIVHGAIEFLIESTDNLKNLSEGKINYSAHRGVDEVIDNLEINKTNIGLFYPGQSLKVERIIELNIEEGREKAADIVKNRLYAYVKDVLKNFANNKKIKELFQNGERVFAELPFTIALDRKDKDVFENILNLMENHQTMEIIKHNQSILINGVIDLIIKSKNNSWTILDHKTDRPLMEKENLPDYLRKTYENQLLGYKILFEEIMKDENIKIDNLMLYSTYMDEVISINN